MDNILLQIDIADRFLQATECSSVTVILGVLAVVLFLVVIKQYKRNTALSDHIMEADKNNAVLMVELNANIDKTNENLKKVYKHDETNTDKIIEKINNIKC